MNAQSICDAEILLLLLREGREDKTWSRITFGFYYRVREEDAFLAHAILRDTIGIKPATPKQKLRLRELD